MVNGNISVKSESKKARWDRAKHSAYSNIQRESQQKNNASKIFDISRLLTSVLFCLTFILTALAIAFIIINHTILFRVTRRLPGILSRITCRLTAIRVFGGVRCKYAQQSQCDNSNSFFNDICKMVHNVIQVIINKIKSAYAPLLAPCRNGIFQVP